MCAGTQWHMFCGTESISRAMMCTIVSVTRRHEWEAAQSIRWFRIITCYHPQMGCCTEMFWLLSEECETPVRHDVVWPGLCWERPQSGFDLLLYNRFKTAFKQLVQRKIANIVLPAAGWSQFDRLRSNRSSAEAWKRPGSEMTIMTTQKPL